MPPTPNLTDRAREDLELLTSLLSRHVNRAESTIVRLSSGSGVTLNRLRRGLPITTERVDRIICWFAANWPVDLEWPSTVRRPAIPKSSTKELCNE